MEEWKIPEADALEDLAEKSDSDCASELPVKKFTKNNIKWDNRIFIFIMLFLPVVSWMVFWLYVNAQSIMLAFLDGRTGEMTLKNFTTVWNLIKQPVDNQLGLSIVNTLKYFGVMMIINTPLCLIIAYFFYKRIALYKVFRIVFYLPAIISSVVYVTAFSEFIDPSGPLGVIQKLLGIKPNLDGLLHTDSTATNTIMIYCVYTGLTTNILLFTSGMSRIPIEVLEAANLDGVGTVRELTNIIFPLIWPTFSTQLVFMMTGVFSSSGPILLFTNGANKTSTISYWIFRQMYGGAGGGVTSPAAYNQVACVGLCFTLLGLPIILMVRKIVEHIDPVEY